MSDHAHDAEGNCLPPENGFYAQSLPTWKFSVWDVVGIVLTGTGGAVNAFANMLGYIGRECAAQANYSRQNFELAEAHRLNERARRQMAEGLRAIVEGGEGS